VDLSEYVLEPLVAQPIVFVVHNDASVRESLESLIRCEGWQSETFALARDFLARPRPLVANCLVLDVSLRDLNGLDLQRRVVVERPDTPVIFVTGHGDVPTSVQAMKAGAIEFLMNPFSDEVLLSAIREGLRRSSIALNREAGMRLLRDRYASLSHRERQVMALVASGLLNKEVGAELAISEITVKAHRGQVMRKMKAESFADLIRMAARLRSELALLAPRFDSGHRIALKGLAALLPQTAAREGPQRSDSAGMRLRSIRDDVGKNCGNRMVRAVVG
jgi:FixJ family two-component response regulator